MPQIEVSNGSKDHVDHLETYKALMHLHVMPNEIMCKEIPKKKLTRSERLWFDRLKPKTINSFSELS